MNTAKNPYGLRQRSHGFYVLATRITGLPIATHWTGSEDTARKHVQRQGHYGVRFARAETVTLQLAAIGKAGA